jgi:hypothetical protein
VEALRTMLPDPIAQPLLEGFVAADADPYVRGLAGVALALGGGSDPAREALSAAYKGEPERWRAAPLALGALTLGDSAAQELLSAALASGDLALEVDMVLAVGNSGQPHMIEALRTGATHIEPEMELPYAAARIALGDSSAEQVLRKAVSGPEIERRLEALDYLVDLQDPASTALLRKARAVGPELATWYADLALAARGSGRVDTFAKAMEEPDREIRALAARHAADAVLHSESRRASRTGRNVLRSALLDEAPDVRIEGLRALARIGIRGETEEVAMNLEHPSAAVRLEAAGLLFTAE